MRQSVTDAANNRTAYTYDRFNRLTRAQTTDTGGATTADYTYGYDSNSNRTSATALGQATVHAAYNGANELCWTGSSAGACGAPPTGATTYTYDANGNQTGNSAGQLLTYNAKNQATSIKKAGGSATSMTYADLDQTERTQAGTVSFVSSILGVQIAKDGTTSTFYTRDNRGNLIGQRKSSTTHYYLVDGLGSIIGLINTSGTLMNTYKYDPYGTITSSTGTVANPWRFASGHFDTQTGLTKFGARFEESVNGRWTQPDVIQGSIQNPSTMNRFAYAQANPVNVIDPSGREGLLSQIIALIGFGASAAGFLALIAFAPEELAVFVVVLLLDLIAFSTSTYGLFCAYQAAQWC
jgi:RHS repeat-associated protein